MTMVQSVPGTHSSWWAEVSTHTDTMIMCVVIDVLIQICGEIKNITCELKNIEW